MGRIDQYEFSLTVVDKIREKHPMHKYYETQIVYVQININSCESISKKQKKCHYRCTLQPSNIQPRTISGAGIFE
jgi:hypothetical protein